MTSEPSGESVPVTDLVEIAARALYENQPVARISHRWEDAPTTRKRYWRDGARHVVEALGLAAPDHYVTFDRVGWFVEHSLGCRMAGTLGTCEHNAAVRAIAEDFDPGEDPDQLGRWRISAIDSEGLPSLERVPPGGDADSTPLR